VREYSDSNPSILKKYTKKEIRDAATSAIHGLMARLDVPLKGKSKKLAKDVSKVLAREIADEYKKHLKKLRKVRKPPEV
jgi:hypothetical protein